jgi:cell division protein FtsN
MIKETDSSKKARYQFELSFSSLVFWLVCIVFFMGWIFVLGVLVGRGFLPGADTAIADLKAQVTKLQELVGRNRRGDQKPQAKEDIDSRLGFYERLQGKEEDRRKPFAESPPEPAKSEKAAKAPDTTLAGVKADIVKKESSAKKQGMANGPGPEGKGKEAVRGPAKEAERTPGPFRYVIQIAALAERGKAEDMVRTLSGRGVDAYFQETVVKGKTYYRVRCGKFVTKEEANQYALKLPKEAGRGWQVVNVE